MTSKIKVDNINKVSDDSNIIKKCSSTTTVGSGAGNTIVVDGSTVTLGRCSGTVALASGATQTGFGRTGTVDWVTTPKTSTFTAVNGEGYFANTSGGAFNMNLPAGSAGDIVAVKDYLNSFDTYPVTIVPNGTDKIGGTNANYSVSTESLSLTLIYVDGTRGWVDIHESTQASEGAVYISATGGNAIATCGNFKTHIFTGPGTFCVASLAGSASNNVVDYLVVAGGGGGSGANGPGCGGRGGGGAGGGRTFQSTPTTSPLNGPAGITVTASPYSITVGGGGTAGPPSGPGGNGNSATFSTITSAGGGYGAQHPATGGPGGSGGGTFASDTGGTGNTPPVSPPQGNSAVPNPGSPGGGTGGGGWASAPPGSAPTNAGTAGGAGSYVPDSFIGPTAPSYGEGSGPVPATRYFAGGGGGGGYNAAGGAGGIGGGGCGVNSYGPGGCGSPAIPGDANTGGGGGSVGAAGPSGTNGGAGGSGVVMIRYRYQ